MGCGASSSAAEAAEGKPRAVVESIAAEEARESTDGGGNSTPAGAAKEEPKTTGDGAPAESADADADAADAAGNAPGDAAKDAGAPAESADADAAGNAPGDAANDAAETSERGTVVEVGHGGGGMCTCVTIADELNPDGTRKDPQTCWDRTRDKGRLLNAVKSNDAEGLEKVLRRMHSEKATLSREGTFVADKRKLNLGNTALCKAVTNQWLTGVKLLCSYKVGINTPNMRGATPLFLASYYGFDEIVEVLLQAGAETGVVAWQGPSLSGKKAEAVAQKADNPETEVLTSESWEDEGAATPKSRKHRTAASFVKNSDDAGIAALHVAADRGHVAAVRLLRRYGASLTLVDYEGRTAVHYAARRLNAEMLDALATTPDSGTGIESADAKSAVNARTNVGRTPLEVAFEAVVAAAGGDAAAQPAEAEAVAKRLIKMGADANASFSKLSRVPEQAPLHFAVRQGWVSVARLVVAEGGADVNAVDPTGVPPIVIAARLGPAQARDMADAIATPALNADAADTSGETAMKTAVQGWPLEHEDAIAAFAEYLITCLGASVDARFVDEGGASVTALIAAVARGMSTHVVPGLVKGGANVNATDSAGASAALYASRYGVGGGAPAEERALELLRALGSPDVRLADGNGSTPLETCLGMWLGGSTGVAFVDAAVALGADVQIGSQYEGEVPLLIASRKGKLEESRALLRHGADPNKKHVPSGRTAAHAAARVGNAALLSALLDAGADSNAQGEGGETVLLVAVGAESEACTRTLLDRNVDPEICKSSDGASPLLVASANGSVKLMELLISRGANPARALIDTRQNALHLAVTSGNPRASAVLCSHAIEQGIASLSWINAMDADGRTPLAIVSDATQRGDSRDFSAARATSALLLDAGADPNVLNRHGTPLLVAAARNDEPALVTVLLTRARRPLENLPEALTEFARLGNAGMCESLLLAGADPGGEQLTAALEAAAVDPRSALRIAGLLIRFGGRVDTSAVNARTTDGDSWLDVAAFMDDASSVHMLVAAGFGEAPEAIADALVECAVHRSVAAAAALLSYPGCEDPLETTPLISCLYDEFLDPPEDQSLSEKFKGTANKLGDAFRRIENRLLSGGKKGRKEEDPAHAAIRARRLKLATLLLAEGADGDLGSALAYSVDAGEHELLTMLIMSGCSVYHEPGLLERALKKHDHVAVGILLAAGIPITHQDMVCAIKAVSASTENAPCAMLLLNAGGPVDATDAQGRSLLENSYRNGSINFRDPAALRILEQVESEPIHGLRNDDFLNPKVSGVDVLGHTKDIEDTFERHTALCHDFIDKEIWKEVKKEVKEKAKEEAQEYAKEQILVAGKEAFPETFEYWEARMEAAEGQPKDLSECDVFDMSRMEMAHEEQMKSSEALSDSGISQLSMTVSTHTTQMIRASTGEATSALNAAAGPLKKVFNDVALEAAGKAAWAIFKIVVKFGVMVMSGGISELLGALSGLAALASMVEGLMQSLQLAKGLWDLYKANETFIEYGRVSIKFGKMIMQRVRWPADLLVLRLLMYCGADTRACPDALAALATAKPQDEKDPTRDSPFENAWEWAGLVDASTLSFPDHFQGYWEEGERVNEKYGDALERLENKFEEEMSNAEDRGQEKKYRKEFNKMKEKIESQRMTELSTVQFKIRKETLERAFFEHTQSMRDAEQWWTRQREAAGMELLDSRQEQRAARVSERAQVEDPESVLRETLAPAQLDGFVRKLVDDVRVQEVNDLRDVEAADLEAIGMSEEQQSTFFALVLGKNTEKRDEGTAAAPPQVDPESVLRETLAPAQLDGFVRKLVDDVRVQEVNDLRDVEAADLEAIGMSEEQQSAFFALVLGKNTEKRDEGTAAAPPQVDPESVLRETLAPAQLDGFVRKLVDDVRVQEVNDLRDVEAADLEAIGMSEEQQSAFFKLLGERVGGIAAPAPAVEV